MTDKCFKCGAVSDFEVTVNGTPREMCSSCVAELLALIKEDESAIKSITVEREEVASDD